jgi:lipoteichoic acid synthase
MRRYFTCMAYVDSTLQAFVGGVRKANPRATVFIFGDHIPQLRSHSYHEALARVDERRLEFVPLFILTPDNRIHVEKKRAASLLDIAPTLLAASGVPYHLTTWGQDLLSDSLTALVPFRGRTYSRERLYQIADAAVR